MFVVEQMDVKKKFHWRRSPRVQPSISPADGTRSVPLVQWRSNRTGRCRPPGSNTNVPPSFILYCFSFLPSRLLSFLISFPLLFPSFSHPLFEYRFTSFLSSSFYPLIPLFFYSFHLNFFFFPSFVPSFHISF